MEESKLLESQGFQVFRTIGEGSFGKAFLVHHPDFGIIAAKVMKNENFEAREWDAAGVFVDDPPNIRPFIIQNIAAKYFDKMTVILIEWANIGNLKTVIDTNVDIPIPIVRAIMNQLYFKPANILLHTPTGSGKVICKIADFGEAKLIDRNIQTLLMTKAGTPAYMPPEFILGGNYVQVNANDKVDIWSLGMIFYQIVFHTFPFNLQNNGDINQFMTNGILIRPERVTDDVLWNLLEQMLQFDKNKRISAELALRHPFLTNEKAVSEITAEQKQISQFANKVNSCFS
ncbi:MAG: hypothetical protein EZS28_018310 [Streblomastix strix]|uniref:Protein kinase domain-containing protein n=1 Tax=Streblomastix strix TaxID=222440 RepID=A0A5J4VU10_9EUKA|nr:MAG: hypothetical protein EZS28_018310 [Streblomastix strix]